MNYSEVIKHFKSLQKRYTTEHNGKMCEKVQLALEALEKQTPKKPIKCDREIRYAEVWECPNCGFKWSGRVVDFCYRCGQAIDWGESE